MDFIDYETLQNNDPPSVGDNALPEPAPPLILPINPDITNRFKKLSLLKNHFPSSETTNDTVPASAAVQDEVNITSRTAEKYAKVSIELLNSHQHNDQDKLISDLPTTTSTTGTKPSDQTDKLSNHFHSSSSTGAGAKTTSVLSARLSKVLNTYDNNDPKLREALSLLQTKSIMDIDQLVRSDLLGSIARRNFRSEIENDLLKQHSNVLKDFQPVVQRIETIGEKIQKLNKVNETFQGFDKLDPQLANEIESLSNAKNLLILKKNLLLNFKKKFTLNQFEEHILTNEDISLDFFKVLNKCKKIHSNCSILLTLGNQDLGLNIMRKMDKFLDLSYQRLSFYLENKLLKNLNEESLSSNKQDLKFLKISIYHLSDNAEVFNEMITKLVQLRSKAIVDEFLFQLNNADSNDNQGYRPIVLSAHDPLRYIGDILAYVHSVVVNEVEFIKNLFTKTDKYDDEVDTYEPSSFEKSLVQIETVGTMGDVESITNDTLVKIINSLARPLKIRTEQIIRSEKNLETIQKIFNLLDLFIMMYEKILPKNIENVEILDSLDSLKSLTVEKVFGLIKEYLKTVDQEISEQEQQQSDDLLLPPDWIRDYLSDVLILFMDVSLGSNGNIFNLTDDLYGNLCGLIIDSPISKLDTYSKELTDKRQFKIFKLNCLDLIQSKIITIPQLSSKFDELNSRITELKQSLIQHQYELLLQDSQLSIHQQLITLIFPIDQIEVDDDYAMYASLVENKLFGIPKLKEIETRLHEFLPVALMDIQQSLFKISSPIIANDIITESSLKFIHLYKVFHRILDELYPEEKILEWNTFDVATLLGVEEAYKTSNFV